MFTNQSQSQESVVPSQALRDELPSENSQDEGKDGRETKYPHAARKLRGPVVGGRHELPEFGIMFVVGKVWDFM